MTSALSSNTWPPWTNGRIELFHGTTFASALNILNGGVDLSKCDQNADFGRGFYTTTHRKQADIFAGIKADEQSESGAILRLSLNRVVLGKLNAICFVRGTVDAVDFWSLIHHCRRVKVHAPPFGHGYDVAYGPVARKWRGPENSEVWPGYDQISFHTQDGTSILNDKVLCSMEIA